MKWEKLTPSTRLHGLEVPVIGLTGGIATGKSTVSRMLVAAGMALIDADKLVKHVYALEETQEFIRQKHPDAWNDGAIHYPTLREKFFSDPQVKEELERFIYARLPSAFLEAYRRLGSPPYVIYDVPLLFEKQLEGKVDLRVLVYAPRKIQKARLMQRDGLTAEMAETILVHQGDIEQKRLRSDIVIDNSGNTEELAVHVDTLLKIIL